MASTKRNRIRRTTVSVSLPSDLVDQLDDEADRVHESRSRVVELLLSAGIESGGVSAE